MILKPTPTYNRIDATLKATTESNKIALAPFITVGFPNIDTSVNIAEAILRSGSDFLELGVPFSDPMAEGPTIQQTSSQALEQGVNVGTCIKVVKRLRDRAIEAPLILMGYFNPFLQYGQNEFVRDAANAGVDGLIVPDLPCEEATTFNQLCQDHNLHLIPLLAPTSTNERIEQACKHASGFIYCVSVTGVTGARANLRNGVVQLVNRIRRYTDLPVLVGFGVSTPSHVKEIGRSADGVIVGSALLDAINKSPESKAVQVAVDFLAPLRGVER